MYITAKKTQEVRTNGLSFRTRMKGLYIIFMETNCRRQHPWISF